MEYIIVNLSTIIVAIVVIILVVLVVIFMIKKRGQGKFMCGGDCAKCSNDTACNLEKANEAMDIKEKGERK